ncbi:hypothetical protein GUJ93_ZPchr0001g32833 [Zizania palustris]|uniref:Uncharacterized protein n=1 Tax=Zizania palustris TaxID=103762 RepID=A0A8J5VNJ8_ZIZPA|nr:hypothetical protein GUJ93_ZPchr0001g32833 [Zizania palustris]
MCMHVMRRRELRHRDEAGRRLAAGPLSCWRTTHPIKRRRREINGTGHRRRARAQLLCGDHTSRSTSGVEYSAAGDWSDTQRLCAMEE